MLKNATFFRFVELRWWNLVLLWQPEKFWILNFLDNFNIAILVPKIAKKTSINIIFNTRRLPETLVKLLYIDGKT